MNIKQLSMLAVGILAMAGWACVDNELDVQPSDQDFPLQLVLDTDEGADLADAEDYDLEIAFADHVGALPDQPVVISYRITGLEGDMIGAVQIDKIVYEYEDDDCTFERELEFAASGDGTEGTITVAVDPDLGTVPPSFDVVFLLPGHDNTEGGFSFEMSGLQGPQNVILGAPASFTYEVLDSDIAGEWTTEIQDEAAFDRFKEVFGPLNGTLAGLSYGDITGKVTAEFEFGEMKFIVGLAEEHDVVSCVDGETETETENIEIEIEADYDADDGELILEGSHLLTGDDGELEGELDFQIEARYVIVNDNLRITFVKVIDEDHFGEGDELFADDAGVEFIFEKD